MGKPNKTILIYTIAFLATALAIYFFIRTYQLKSELSDLTLAHKSLNQKARLKQGIKGIDTLMLIGEYNDAISAYENLDAAYSEHFGSEIAWRIQLAQRMLAKGTLRSQNIDTAAFDESQSITQSRPNDASPKEVRAYDSLSFALEKANLKIVYLNKQIGRTKAGAYLSFTTSKGKELYYVGEVKDKKANGKGVAILVSGSRYEGTWKDNRREGKGKFYWPDGQYYEGDYKNDKRHGTGTYYWPNGDKYIGNWENDHRNGEGTFFGKDEKVVSGIWKKDKLLEVSKKD